MFGRFDGAGVIELPTPRRRGPSGRRRRPAGTGKRGKARRGGAGRGGLPPELGFGIAHWSACWRVYIALGVRIGAVVGFTGGGPVSTEHDPLRPNRGTGGRHPRAGRPRHARAGRPPARRRADKLGSRERQSGDGSPNIEDLRPVRN